jgi:hypothetical protein
MDSVFVQQLRRSRHLVVLLLLLNMLTLALIAGGQYGTGVVVLQLVLLAGTAALLFMLRNRSMTAAVTHAQEPVLALDPNTGIATENWFRHMLALECRRAVREFAPLTVMRISLGDQVQREHLLEVIRVLSEELSRPGDLIGWETGSDLGAVLPCTNEHAEQLTERCYRHIREHSSNPDLPVWLVAQTYQPRGDLNLAKVSRQLEQRMQQARQDAPGVYYSAEAATDPAAPSMTYTDG